MTLNELKDRVTVRRMGYGSYSVTINYGGRPYHCTSNNSLAWDRINDRDLRETEVGCGYTYKGAYAAFYDECKRKNNIEDVVGTTRKTHKK